LRLYTIPPRWDRFYPSNTKIIQYLYPLFVILCFNALLTSCSKDSNADLEVNYTLGENGSVRVTAEAPQAVVYRFSFEPNAVFENSSGDIEYTYANKGNYTLGIWAFFDTEYNSYSYQTVTLEITNASGNASASVDPNNIDTSEETTVYSDYTLVWNDEFNYEGTPSDKKWHHQYIPIIGGSWANSEKQHYTARTDNSFVSDGTLKIVAKRETYTFEGSRKSFTSARLNSKFELEYGRIDVRAKLPSAEGTWPAIWTLGTNVGERGNYHGTTAGNEGWPACGEIDIMEQDGTDKEKLYGTFHWADASSGQNASYGLTKTRAVLGIGTPSADFHLYSLVWTPATLKIFVDNVLLVQLTNSSSVPFDNPHYLLLNIAMGGTLGGSIPSSFSQDTMEVDYVRFYQ
jgi:beta-glucanase (GH16 family)